MLALAVCSLTLGTAVPSLPDSVDLRSGYSRYGLSVCRQSGPLCWDYTVVGLLEYELATGRHGATRLSPGFLSWAATATDHESQAGSNFGRAYRGLEKYGIAPLELGGDPDANGKGRTPSAEALEAAGGLGQVDVRWIRFWNNSERLSSDQFQAIESELAAGHPVAVGMRWPNHTAFVAGKPFLMKVPAENDIFDGHCVALVGYTKAPDAPGGGAFLFRNSWGEEWADHGYGWMPFALLSFCINDALSVRIAQPLKPAGPDTELQEAEDLAIENVDGPRPTVQDMSRFGRTWRGQKQVFFQASKAGEGFALALPVAKPGDYELRLRIGRAQDYGIFKVSIGGASATIDGSGPGYSRSNWLSCGTARLRAGTNRLTFTVQGHDSASSGLAVGIDALELLPKGL